MFPTRNSLLGRGLKSRRAWTKSASTIYVWIDLPPFRGVRNSYSGLWPRRLWGYPIRLEPCLQRRMTKQSMSIKRLPGKQTNRKQATTCPPPPKPTPTSELRARAIASHGSIRFLPWHKELKDTTISSCYTLVTGTGIEKPSVHLNILLEWEV